MAQQTSRLHRLLTLLDTGSTSTTRRTAARQIGEIAKQHRGELRPLLRRVRQFLRSKSWDTRVAAAQAIGAVAENVPHLTVKDLVAKAEAELGEEGHLERDLETLVCHRSEDGALTFRRFDMQGVLENGAQLLSSQGQEYDVGVDNSKTPAERLARQKQNLRRRLGLDGCEQFMDVNDMIRDEDLSATGNGEVSARDFFAQPHNHKQEVYQLVATMVPGGLSRTLSARERNMLKRKAKVLPKEGAKEWGEEEEIEEPASKRAKQTKSVISEQAQGGDTKLVVDVVLDDENQEGDTDGEWPFNHIVELLIHDMFDPVWEVRHGSLMALREILSVQAASAGVTVPSAEAGIEVEVEEEAEAEAEAEAVPNNLSVLENMESGKATPPPSPQKESMIDLNLDMASVEDNGEFKKAQEHSSPEVKNHNWTGLPEVTNNKPDWMKAEQHAVKTELSLGGMKSGLKMSHLKPEGLDALNPELNLDLGKSEGLNSLKPELNLDLGKSEGLNSPKPELNLDLGKSEGLNSPKPELNLDLGKSEGLNSPKPELNLDLGKSEGLNSLKPELNLDLGKSKRLNSLKPELNLDLGKSEGLNSLKPELNLDLGKSKGLNSLKPELNLDLGKSEGLNSLKPELNSDLSMVKPGLSLGVVKQELELDLNMEVELDLNMEVKEETVTMKEERLPMKEESATVKAEPLTVKEERKLESETQPNLFWQPHVAASEIKESNDSKVVAAAKKALAANIGFLQDCTIRLLCVFALDRFGDYVSDQVVAPVRETCAQVMGAVMKQMPPPLVHESLSILLQMQNRPEWEVRHGSLLGIKYLVAVRQEMLQELLPRVLPACMAGLEDADDDVRAVAAEALTPAAAAIVASAGAQNVTAILLSLWDILLDLDDLSPSTSSVMHLLAELYSQPQVESKTVVEKPMILDLNETMMDDLSANDTAEDDPFLLSTLAPRLWPFMRHNITSVRLAAIRTLERLLESGDYRAEGDTGSSWAVPILGDALRMVFQNLLLESDEAVIQCSQRVWRLLLQCPEANLAEEATAYLSSWLKLASTAAGAPLEASRMYSPNSLPRKSRGRAVAKLKAVHRGASAIGESSWQPPRPNNKVREQSFVVVGADGEKSAVLMRVTTARALGIFAASLPSVLFPTVATSLNELLSSPLGTQRQVASMMIVSWFKEICNRKDQEKTSEAATAVQPVLLRLSELLGCGDPSSPTPGSNAPYGELSRMFAKMRMEAGALIKHTESVGTFKRSLLASLPSTDTISAEAAVELATKLVQPSQPHGGDGDDKTTSASDALELARQRLLSTAGYLQVVQGNLHMSVLASLAGAVVWMGELPVKLNPVIQPLMAAIKREQEEALQQPAAEALAEVIVQCVGRKPSPNEKLIKNLCALTCADPIETPKALQTNAIAAIPEETEAPPSGKGNKHAKLPLLSPGEERARAEGAITRRGAELALKSLCIKFGISLLNQLPKLWDCLTESLGQPAPPTSDQASVALPVLTAEAQALIINLQVVRSTAPVVDKALHPELLTLLPAIFSCVRHDHAAVRLVASRCLTAMAQTMLEPVMASVLTTAVPMLGDTMSVEARQGAGMLITALVEGLGTELVAYAPLLIVPLLGCMSDSNPHVRQSVTKSFAALVPLLPLARGVPPPKGLDEFQASRSADDTRFLEQLLDNTQVDDYKLLVPINVTLRRYQQEGINWLAFLKRFKLHGILCDDMGLGKTLQASAIVASDTVERAAAFTVSKSPDVAPLPSLVVCPSTLVGHWAYEIEKFIPADILNPLQYAGSPQERINLRSRFPMHNIIITSYDVLRKDIDVLAQQVWNYCILDEGHIIKSAKSKITIAAKRIQADHRLLLSGTPIQNNVLELWSLFDFLMPGFLGTERQFQANYGKPLQASREGKCSSKEAEAGVLAMEALHKQVMPFLLRRTKDEVLADLPPKIIQDRYCDLSPLQLQLYEDFSHSQAKQEVSSLVQTYGGPDVPEARAATAPSTHVFQALQYLRKLCSHPLLVLEDERQAARHADAIAQSGSKDLHELQHAPKLQALRDILEECGIGMPAAAETSGSAEGGHHRVLIFAQLKNFLDIIEKDLFQTHMKGVTYLRLDGSVESDKRFDIVKAFNSDPTIDVLLLTTHVGGLGLNLTAADTVVFMEHDWNPMRDLQAMDRAHRLGQKRVVNVHRLIMRGTLEEKIMSLQRFKISVANTVINAENASLNTMDTTQLLDLFTVSGNSLKGGEDESDAAASVGGANKGLKAMLNNLEELWDQSQYIEEYNLGQFVARLNG